MVTGLRQTHREQLRILQPGPLAIHRLGKVGLQGVPFTLNRCHKPRHQTEDWASLSNSGTLPPFMCFF